MSNEFNWWKHRDNFHNDSRSFDKVEHVSETMRLAFSLPYDYMQDSIVASNARQMDATLDTLATLINKKLLKDIRVADEDKFLPHFGVKIEVDGDEDIDNHVIYTPFTLSFSDGQVVTALVANTANVRSFQPSKEVKVERWAINNKDVTEFVSTGTNSEISSSLSKIINKLHSAFIKKNPQANQYEELKREIQAIEIDTSVIEWLNENEEDATPEPVVRVEKDSSQIKSSHDRHDIGKEKPFIDIKDKAVSTAINVYKINDLKNDVYGKQLGELLNDANDIIADYSSKLHEKFSGEFNDLLDSVILLERVA